MGLTGFNLVRREEEAAASAVASLTTEPEVQACPAPTKEEAPKRGRRKPTEEAG